MLSFVEQSKSCGEERSLAEIIKAEIPNEIKKTSRIKIRLDDEAKQAIRFRQSWLRILNHIATDEANSYPTEQLIDEVKNRGWPDVDELCESPMTPEQEDHLRQCIADDAFENWEQYCVEFIYAEDMKDLKPGQAFVLV